MLTLMQISNGIHPSFRRIGAQILCCQYSNLPLSVEYQVALRKLISMKVSKGRYIDPLIQFQISGWVKSL